MTADQGDTLKMQVYAHIEPETLIDKGLAAGLSEQAADYFRHFEEVALLLTVDKATGHVYKVELAGRTEFPKPEALDAAS